MGKISGLFRLFAPKALGWLAGGAAGYVYVKSKGTITLNPEEIVNLVVTVIAPATVASKAAEIKLNPSGSSAPVLIQEGLAKKDELKAMEENDSRFRD